MFYKLSATIVVETNDKASELRSESLFIATYFQGTHNTRSGVELKYQSLVTVDSFHIVINEISKKLDKLGIENYSFNITTNYLLENLT